MMDKSELYCLLEELHDRYNRPEFIPDDPISVPHSFMAKDDIEIAGFLSSVIAWGARPIIVRNARRMMSYMDNAPAAFVRSASEGELRQLRGFVHRTFNGGDLVDFVLALRGIFQRFSSLGGYFESRYSELGTIPAVLADFRREFFASDHAPRCEKHISSIERGAACKRLNMFLRWMVRRDNRGVDFGLWQSIPASALYLPLDVHAGNVARALGLLTRRQNDWRAVEEVTLTLRSFSKDDPVRYDFALFGAGISGLMKQ